jgi:hypothetical protein
MDLMGGGRHVGFIKDLLFIIMSVMASQPCRQGSGQMCTELIFWNFSSEFGAWLGAGDWCSVTSRDRQLSPTKILHFHKKINVTDSDKQCSG